jgi:hypothetical protein
VAVSWYVNAEHETHELPASFWPLPQVTSANTVTVSVIPPRRHFRSVAVPIASAATKSVHVLCSEYRSLRRYHYAIAMLAVFG